MKGIKGRIQGEEAEQTQRVPIIGNIRVGEKDEKGLPHSLDYFKATGTYANMFHQCFGGQPEKIEIVFFSDNVLDVCFERWELRKGAKLYGYSDGTTTFVWDKKDYKQTKAKMDAIAKEVKSEKGWERILTLTFAILKIRGVFGMWRFSTKAEASSLPQIKTAFDVVQQKGGTVINVPFDLLVKKVVDQKPDSKASYPVVTLVPNVSQEHLELMNEALIAGKEIKGIATEEKIDAVMEEAGEALVYPLKIGLDDVVKDVMLPDALNKEKKGTKGKAKPEVLPDPPKNNTQKDSGKEQSLTDAVVEEFNGTEQPSSSKNPKGDIKKALIHMGTITTMEKLRETRKGLSKRSWTPKEKGILDKRLDDVAQGLEQQSESPFK